MAEYRNDVTLDILRRQKDVWVNIDRSKKELAFSLSGGGSGSKYALALCDTKENWRNKPTFVPSKGMIIVYTDYDVIIRDGQEVYVPGIKIGDGLAYVVDLPFVFENWIITFEEHIQNEDIHVSKEEKEFWNAKLNYEMAGETLILNKE